MEYLICVCVCVGFLALGDNWQLYCRAVEFYLQQVAAHSILGKSPLLHNFLSSTEVPHLHHTPYAAKYPASMQIYRIVLMALSFQHKYKLTTSA